MTILKWGLIGVCAFIVVGLGIASNKTMPDAAEVYLDDATRTYLAPPCMQEWRRRPGTGTATVMQVATARARGYEPDPICRDAGGFVGANSSLTKDLLVDLGIVDGQPEWWDYTLAEPVPVLLRNNPS